MSQQLTETQKAQKLGAELNRSLRGVPAFARGSIEKPMYQLMEMIHSLAHEVDRLKAVKNG